MSLLLLLLCRCCCCCRCCIDWLICCSVLFSVYSQILSRLVACNGKRFLRKSYVCLLFNKISRNKDLIYELKDFLLLRSRLELVKGTSFMGGFSPLDITTADFIRKPATMFFPALFDNFLTKAEHSLNLFFIYWFPEHISFPWGKGFSDLVLNQSDIAPRIPVEISQMLSKVIPEIKSYQKKLTVQG